MKKTTISFLLFFLITQVFAQRHISIEEAVSLAITHNLSLKNQRIESDILQRNADSAWNSLWPSIGASASANLPLNNGSAGNWSLSAGASASLNLSAASFSGIQTATLRYEAGRISLEQARREIELSVRKGFSSLLLGAENLRLLEQSYESQKAQYEQTRIKAQSGLASELDILNAQVNLENAKANAASRALSLQNQLAQFTALLGLEKSEKLIPKGSLELPAMQELASRTQNLGAQSPNASVANLLSSIAISEYSIKSAKLALYLPALSLSVSQNLDLSDFSLGGSIRIGLSWSLDNLFPWTRSPTAVKNSQADLDILKNRLAQAYSTAAITIKNLIYTIEQGLSVLKTRELALELAERSLQLTQEAWIHGTKDQLALQESHDAVQRAQIHVLEQRWSILSTILDLEYELGLPFGSLTNGQGAPDA